MVEAKHLHDFGSGQLQRDEVVAKHRLFLVLASPAMRMTCSACSKKHQRFFAESRCPSLSVQSINCTVASPSPRWNARLI